MADFVTSTTQKTKVQLHGRQTITPCPVLPFGSHGHPVQIDGDLYLPTIMTEPFLANFILERQSEHGLDDWLGSTSENTSFLCIWDANAMDFSLRLSDGRNTDNYPENQPWPWRPVLIPLTKDRQPDSILRQYKNGETVKAGTLVFCGDRNDMAIKIKPNGLGTTMHLNRIKFADSDGQNDLEWMAWKGVLVSTRNILACTTDDLARLHLATYFDAEAWEP